MKHTKGKWEVHPSVSESVAGLTVITKDGDSVGEVYGSDIEGQRLATLFASAPELFEALKAMTKLFEERVPYPNNTQRYKQAIKAIAKAEGK